MFFKFLRGRANRLFSTHFERELLDHTSRLINLANFNLEPELRANVLQAAETLAGKNPTHEKFWAGSFWLEGLRTCVTKKVFAKRLSKHSGFKLITQW